MLLQPSMKRREYVFTKYCILNSRKAGEYTKFVRLKNLTFEPKIKPN